MRLTRIAAPLSGVVAACTSVVCMASMGAMAAVSTAGTMAGMGAAATATTRTPVLTQALRAIGLGGLAHLSNAVLQPLLIILLLVAVAAALWQARATPTKLTMTRAIFIMLAAVGLYASIYVAVSEVGYWIALPALVLASVLLLRPARSSPVPEKCVGCG